MVITGGGVVGEGDALTDGEGDAAGDIVAEGVGVMDAEGVAVADVVGVEDEAQADVSNINTKRSSASPQLIMYMRFFLMQSTPVRLLSIFYLYHISFQNENGEARANA